MTDVEARHREAAKAWADSMRVWTKGPSGHRVRLWRDDPIESIAALLAQTEADTTAPLRAEIARLREALVRVVAGEDCPFCDSGRLRKRVDGRPEFHADDCGFEFARAALATEPPEKEGE